MTEQLAFHDDGNESMDDQDWGQCQKAAIDACWEYCHNVGDKLDFWSRLFAIEDPVIQEEEADFNN